VSHEWGWAEIVWLDEKRKNRNPAPPSFVDIQMTECQNVDIQIVDIQIVDIQIVDIQIVNIQIVDI
jgi:hypothetical protein